MDNGKKSSHVLIRVVEPRELLVGGGDLCVRRRPGDVEQAVKLVVPRAVFLRVFIVDSSAAAVIAVAPVVVEVVAGRHFDSLSTYVAYRKFQANFEIFTLSVYIRFCVVVLYSGLKQLLSAFYVERETRNCYDTVCVSLSPVTSCERSVVHV